VAGLFLTGLSTRVLAGHRAAAPLLSRALDALTSDDDLGLLWLAVPVAHELWDDTAWHRVSEQAVRSARATGALSFLPTALACRAGALMHAGCLADAAELLAEAGSISQATGPAVHLFTAPNLIAYQGAERPAREMIAAMTRDGAARGEGRLIGIAAHAEAVLHNGLGGYPAALAAARRAAEFPDLGVYQGVLGELIEAAVRAGEPAAAAEARDRLAERTAVAGTDWALGVQAVADALAGPPGHAEDRYREAIERLPAIRLALPLARARLLYGEWLRRENRRADARHQLRAAYEALSAMGARSFADRAGRELAATGETVRKRTGGVPDELTAQEAQIAGLAAAGRTNPEIAAVLFLSPRTVEWHLRKVFAKLAIGSRRELTAALRER
jgi:DNA-binding CsgD family transcriptional regulator